MNFEYNNSKLKEDLHLYYKMSELNPVKDYNGTNDASTIVGTTPTISPYAMVDKCLLFNSGRIVADDDKNITNTNDITISAWVRPDVASSYNCIARAGTNNTYGVFFGNAAGSNSFFHFDSGTRGSAASVGLGVFQHVSFVYDHSSTSMKIYVNGELKSTTSRQMGYLNPTAWVIGSDGSNHFNGKIDEIMIHHRALSDDEIEKLYLYYNRINKSFY
jgi:hypothetical protein